MNYSNNDTEEDNEDQETNEEDNEETTKCPNCGEDVYTQYTCEFCGQSTCADCDTPMKPCLGCGRLVCYDCTEETMSASGYRERICGNCTNEMDRTTFDSYWVRGKKRWKVIG